MKVPLNIFNEIVSHAQDDLPFEACGYIIGDKKSIIGIKKMINIDKSPEHFSFDTKEQFAALKEAATMGSRLIGVYHSHPSTPARMSDEDIKLAHDPDLIYLIYSVLDKKLKAFSAKNNKISEVKLEIEK